MDGGGRWSPCLLVFCIDEEGVVENKRCRGACLALRFLCVVNLLVVGCGSGCGCVHVSR
jgi:hypothetical protein